MHLLVRMRQVRRNIAQNGLRPTLYKVYFYIYGYLYDLSSGGLDTTSPATEETLAEDGTPRGDRTAAFPCHPAVLRHALRSLNVSKADVFLDIGCGKGRALTVAARFPFRRLVGVDLMRTHIDVTQRNLEKLGRSEAELIHADALTVSYPDDVSICFLFKPFPERVILDCLQRLDGHARAIILMGTSGLEEISGYRLHARYSHRPTARFDYLIFEREREPARQGTGSAVSPGSVSPAGAVEIRQ